jgi:hypothetical protein
LTSRAADMVELQCSRMADTVNAYNHLGKDVVCRCLAKLSFDLGIRLDPIDHTSAWDFIYS